MFYEWEISDTSGYKKVKGETELLEKSKTLE